MKRFVNDLKKYFNYARYSAKAELKAEVAGSYLNWIWWILEPVCLMFIYAFIFGFIFEAREEYFTAFIYIGLAVWTFFNQNLKNSVTIIKKNKGVVTKVYLPKFILLESKMFVNAFKMVVSFAIVVVLMVFYRVHLTWNVLFVIPLFICLWLVTFGCMCILCHFGVYVQDLANMTGIMFSIDHRIGKDHPELAMLLGKFNPIAFIIDGCRKSLIYGETPDLITLLVWILIGVCLSWVGVWLIYRNENSYAKVN